MHLISPAFIQMHHDPNCPFQGHCYCDDYHNKPWCGMVTPDEFGTKSLTCQCHHANLGHYQVGGLPLQFSLLYGHTVLKKVYELSCCSGNVIWNQVICIYCECGLYQSILLLIMFFDWVVDCTFVTRK